MIRRLEFLIGNLYLCALDRDLITIEVRFVREEDLVRHHKSLSNVSAQVCAIYVECPRQMICSVRRINPQDLTGDWLATRHALSTAMLVQVRFVCHQAMCFQTITIPVLLRSIDHMCGITKKLVWLAIIRERRSSVLSLGLFRSCLRAMRRYLKP